MSLSRPRLEHTTLGELITLMSSESAEAGSGTAASVAVALAAACLAKAVVLSRKSQPENTALQGAHERCHEIAAQAMRFSDQESERFARTVRSDSTAAEKDLLAIEDRLLNLANEVRALADALAPHINENLKGDVAAAHALRDAGVTILIENERGNSRNVTDPKR